MIYEFIFRCSTIKRVKKDEMSFMLVNMYLYIIKPPLSSDYGNIKSAMNMDIFSSFNDAVQFKNITCTQER